MKNIVSCSLLFICSVQAMELNNDNQFMQTMVYDAFNFSEPSVLEDEFEPTFVMNTIPCTCKKEPPLVENNPYKVILLYGHIDFYLQPAKGTCSTTLLLEGTIKQFQQLRFDAYQISGLKDKIVPVLLVDMAESKKDETERLKIICTSNVLKTICTYKDASANIIFDKSFTDI